jgi:glycosyltransferase involved in cell wall biosynthesis
MRILALSERFQTSAGGSVTYVRNLCRQMAAKGHEVYLLTEKDQQIDVNGDRWSPFEGYWLHAPARKGDQDVFIRADLKTVQKYAISKIDELITEIRPDVIHVLQGLGLARVLDHVPPQIPKLLTLQNVPPQEYTFTRFYSFPLVNNAFKWPYFELARLIHGRTLRNTAYDRLICVSQQTRRFAIDARVIPERTVVIPDGVDPQVFFARTESSKLRASLGGDPLILSAAGVSITKGQLDVVEAMAGIVRIFPGAKYINVGPVRDQPYHDRICARTARLGLSDRCIFLENVSHADMTSYYQACDIYVQPSHQEGFCMAALEAVSCGKPVVATNVGAMPEFVTRCKAGLIIRAGRPDEIEQAVISVLKNPRATDMLSQHNCAAQNYSWEVVAERTIALYREVAAAKS